MILMALLPMLFVSQISLATNRATCGRKFLNSNIELLVKEYEHAFVAAGFQISEKNVMSDRATLRATFTVADSRYQQEHLDEWQRIENGAVIYYPTVSTTKQPADYNVKERNNYVQKFELAEHEVADKIEKRFPQSK